MSSQPGKTSPPGRQIGPRAFAGVPRRIIIGGALALLAVLMLFVASRKSSVTAKLETPVSRPARTCSGGRFYYAAPDGTEKSPGTSAQPLDLATALSDRSPAKRCDTIWVRGGTYKGAFLSVLEGAPDAPIVVRAFPGERAILDSAPVPQPALSAAGAWTWYQGLEIMNSDRLRTSAQAGSWPGDLRRGIGVVARGANLKLVNLIVHDLAHGVVVESSPGTEIYGTIIYNNGWDGPEGSSGHALQSGGDMGTRIIHDNIIFNQFSHGIIAMGSKTAPVDNMDLQGNVLFNNGVIGRSGIARDILIGGGASNTKMRQNSTFGDGRVAIGHHVACPGTSIAENYLVGRAPLILTDCSPSVSGNELFGDFGDIAGRFPQNKYHTAPPTGLVVRTRINRYEPGRLHIAVYNWDEQDEVEVDIAAAQLPEGAHYEIRNAQHFFGDPVMQGVYDGNPRIRVPMRGLVSAPPPIGKADALVPQTAPRFAVFVLVPRAPAPSLTPR